MSNICQRTNIDPAKEESRKFISTILDFSKVILTNRKVYIIAII